MNGLLMRERGYKAHLATCHPMYTRPELHWGTPEGRAAFTGCGLYKVTTDGTCRTRTGIASSLLSHCPKCGALVVMQGTV